ncbi:MAG TPA: hypothetical protein VJ623_11855 [Holophagaceae bacterium]|nr:hypothetical protein [Holophagaceae bacterium]
MIVLAFLYAALMGLAALLGWRHRAKPGVRWFLLFLGLDALSNGVAYLSWAFRRPNQWVANLGTLVIAATLIPALAEVSIPAAGRLFRLVAVLLVVAGAGAFLLKSLGATDDLVYPMVCLAVVAASGAVLWRLILDPIPLWSRMPFWWVVGALFAFGVDLLPWVLSEEVAKASLQLHRVLWTTRNAAWTLASLCFCFSWTQA